MSSHSLKRQYSTWGEIIPAIHAFVDGNWAETWFFFDLDETLVRPENPALSYRAFRTYWKDFAAELNNGREVTLEQEEAVIAAAVVDTDLSFTEQETFPAIQSFQAKGAKVLALTATITGPLPPHEQFEVERCRQCRALGLHFDDLLQDTRQWGHFVPFRGQFPCYRDGILFANGAKDGSTKGQILCQFLKDIGTPLPKKIVFIDDTSIHVDSVAEELSTQFPEITSLCVEYTQKRVRPMTISYDEFRTALLPSWQRVMPAGKVHPQEPS